MNKFEALLKKGIANIFTTNDPLIHNTMHTTKELTLNTPIIQISKGKLIIEDTDKRTTHYDIIIDGALYTTIQNS